MNKLTNFALPVLVNNGLSNYIRQVNSFPMLTQIEEEKLTSKWINDGNIEAAHNLVTSHLRLVVKIASGFKGYGLPMSDLISEGNIGLMQAVKKYDPTRGARLATCAMWWIKASINEYILRSWSTVKMGTSAAQKKLFYNLRKIKARISGTSGRDLMPDEVSQIALDLGVPERDVIEMDQRLGKSDSSLNAKFGDESDGEWIDFLEDHGANQEVIVAESQELSQRRIMLEKAMSNLNERERKIVTARRLTDPAETLEGLSQKHGVSRERIRQIEARAIEKMQQIVTAQ